MSATDSTPHQLWGGRFVDGAAPEMAAVNRSIGTDFRLWPYDIELSRAWAVALAGAGVITRNESEQLVAGLDRVGARIRSGASPAESDEDIHTMVDRLLHEEAGTIASRLHTGRSRNDQVATATRLWTIDAAMRIEQALRDAQRALVARASDLRDAVMPAYTHLQRAQPVLAAHWLLSHFWPLERDRARVASARESAKSLPLGSGAIAGSSFPVSRTELAAALGFSAPSHNSVDAVSDRDFIAEILFALTLTASHLSRMAEDLIVFGSSEFAFVRFADQYSTGSSMMPQKRNPDALELARGSAGRVLGDLVSMLTTLKGLPSGYNKDLQDDKRVLFDAVDGLLLVLPAVAGTVRTMQFQRERMAAAVSSAMFATDLADYLVRKRVTFRDAHTAVGKLVREAEERNCELGDLSLADFKAASPSFEVDVFALLSGSASVLGHEIQGGTGPVAVAEQLALATSLVAD